MEHFTLTFLRRERVARHGCVELVETRAEICLAFRELRSQTGAMPLNVGSDRAAEHPRGVGLPRAAASQGGRAAKCQSYQRCKASSRAAQRADHSTTRSPRSAVLVHRGTASVFQQTSRWCAVPRAVRGSEPLCLQGTYSTSYPHGLHHCTLSRRCVRTAHNAGGTTQHFYRPTPVYLDTRLVSINWLIN